MKEEKRVEYSLISDHDREDFLKKVNSHLADGWELFGSPSISVVPGPIVYYAQAVTKKDQPIGALGLGSAKRKE